MKLLLCFFLICIAVCSAVLDIDVSPLVTGSKNIILDISIPHDKAGLGDSDRLTIRVSRVKISTTACISTDLYIDDELIPISKISHTTIKNNQMNSVLSFPTVPSKSTVTSRRIHVLLTLSEPLDTNYIDVSATYAPTNSPNNADFGSIRQPISKALATPKHTKFTLFSSDYNSDYRGFKIVLRDTAVLMDKIVIDLLNTHYHFYSANKPDVPIKCTVNGEEAINVSVKPYQLTMDLKTSIPAKTKEVEITCNSNHVSLAPELETAFNMLMPVSVHNNILTNPDSAYYAVGGFPPEIKTTLFIAGIIILACISAVLIILGIYLYTQHLKRQRRLSLLATGHNHGQDSIPILGDSRKAQ